MFNIFKNDLSIGTSVSDKYPDIVQQVHHEFEIAGELLLEGANKILAETAIKDKEKGALLRSLGFTRTKEAQDFNEMEIRESEAKRIADLVSYYAQNYPHNKFITEDKVENICKKYGLVCGDVSRFKGFVPKEKLIQISKFKIKKKEENTIILDNIVPYVTSHIVNMPSSLIIENACVYRLGSYYFIVPIDHPDNDHRAFQSGDGINFYANDDKNIFGLQKYGNIRFTVANKSLKICAPLKDMDITDAKIEGYKIIHQVPDPVVLQVVNGGYLIIAVWGDEASDELVVNEKHN